MVTARYFTISVLLTIPLMLLTGLVSAFASDTAALIEEGKAALEAGRAEEAVQIFSRLIAGERRAGHCYHRGLAYAALSKHGSAIRDFNDAIILDPEQVPYYVSRGVALLRVEQYQDASDDLTIALNMEPNNGRALAYRARALFGLERVERALDDVSSALRLTPDNAVLHKLNGDIQSAAGQFANAVQSYDRAIQLNPSYASAYNNRGVALVNLGKVKEGMQDLTMAMDRAESSGVSAP